MSRNFDDNNDEKKEFGGTLDYYNDEISRKAVGKLFDNDGEGEIASGRESEPPARGAARPADKPISNHFYEESRAEEDSGKKGIVRGFEKEEPERPAPRRARENVRARETNLDDTLTGSGLEEAGKEDREKYRRQFLDEMDKDPKRRPRQRASEMEEEQERPRRSQSRTAPKSEVKKSQSPYPEEFENAEKRYSKRQAERVTYTAAGKKPAYTTSADSTASVLQLPIFKVIGGAFVLLLALMIFLIVRMNGMSKELSAYQNTDETMVTMEEYDSKVRELDSANNMNTALRTENTDLKLEISRLRGEGGEEGGEGGGEEGEGAGQESPGTDRVHTVASGEYLSTISIIYYGNSTTGVDKIRQANNLSETDYIYVGQELKIPQ